jgi:hypothetical protein
MASPKIGDTPEGKTNGCSKPTKNIKSARFSYLDVQFVMLQFGIEKHNYWRSKWGFDSLRLKQIEKVLNDGHALFVKICA